MVLWASQQLLNIQIFLSCSLSKIDLFNSAEQGILWNVRRRCRELTNPLIKILNYMGVTDEPPHKTFYTKFQSFTDKCQLFMHACLHGTLSTPTKQETLVN